MFYIIFIFMGNSPQTQSARAVALLQHRGMARLSDFIEQGITAATISRMKEKGLIVQLARGLYQLPNVLLDANHSLAEAAMLVPKGIVCLDSALAFHELTDAMPHWIWIAIGSREWEPRITHPAIQIVKFTPERLKSGVRTHHIEGVPVEIFDPAKTIVDLFYHAARQRRWYGGQAGFTAAIRGMKTALRLRKATPAEIARYAEEAGITKIIAPYLEALTADA